MAHKSKRFKEIEKIVGEPKAMNVHDAVELLKQCPPVKFDQSVELALMLGVDPKQADQQVRGTVNLPHGTGKKMIVLVFTKKDRVKEALAAGADFAGDEEMIEKVKGGWMGFNAIIATPDMMREVGKLGKILGPRGLMPTPKAGNVTDDIAKAIKELKGGKVEFKVDKTGGVNLVIGKLSFSTENLVNNIEVLINAVAKAKPSSSKGVFLKSVWMSSTMGPGIPIDVQSIVAVG